MPTLSCSPWRARPYSPCGQPPNNSSNSDNNTTNNTNNNNNNNDKWIDRRLLRRYRPQSAVDWRWSMWIGAVDWRRLRMSHVDWRRTANPRTKIMDFRGFDSIIILILRGGILMSIGDFPESLSQSILVGIILVGRSGVAWAPKRKTEFSKRRGIGGYNGETESGIRKTTSTMPKRKNGKHFIDINTVV